jgi:hypothetical protein
VPGQNDRGRCRRSRSGCANGFTNETQRGGKDVAGDTRRSRALRPAQRRYAGTPETSKTVVILLITQRQQAQFRPRLLAVNLALKRQDHGSLLRHGAAFVSPSVPSLFRLTLISTTKRCKPTITEIPAQRYSRRYRGHTQKSELYFNVVLTGSSKRQQPHRPRVTTVTRHRPSDLLE